MLKTIKIKKIIFFLFVATYIIRSITDGLFVVNDINNFMVSSKYITMFLAIIFFFMLKRGKLKLSKSCFGNEMKRMLFLVISFFVISLLFAIIEQNITINTFTILIKMILGIFFAFIILNTLDIDEIYNAMKIILIFAIIGYIIEIGIENFNIENIALINFAKSYSPFESSYFAGIALSTCAFFSYFRKEKKWLILSILFTICTFKRLSLLFAIVLLFLPWFINIDGKIDKKYIVLISVLFVFFTIGYYWILQENNENLFYDIFNETQTQFTMTRSDRLHELINENFQSYGLGSAANELGLELIEMDLIEIYMELTIVGLILFCLTYWSMTSGQIYCCIFMAYQFFNFLTSHSIGGNFSWTINFIIIGSILYKNVKEYKGTRPKFLNIIKMR